MSKKVLSLVLAVAMLVSVFAIAATAYDAGEGGGVRLVSDAEVGMKAGDTVTVKVYLLGPSDVDYTTYRAGLGAIAIGWDTNYYSCDPSTQTYGDDYSSFLKPGTPTNPATAAIKKWDATDTATFGVEEYNASTKKSKGQITGITFQTAYDGSQTTYTSKTGFPLTDPDDAASSEFFSFKLTVKKELTADNKIAVFHGALGSVSKVGFYASGKTTETYYTAAEINYSESVIAPAAPAEPAIKFTGYKACWGAYDKATGTADGDQSKGWNLGIEGTFAAEDIAIAFDEETGSSTNVSAVGVKITGEGIGVGETRYVQDNGDGTYTYRAVVTGIPGDIASDKAITVQFYVTMNGKEILGETVKDIVLADQLTAAIGRGMPEYAPV